MIQSEIVDSISRERCSIDPDASAEWIDICATEQVMPDRGVAAIVDGHPVAVFRLGASNGLPDEWYAVSHIDPFTDAPVIARGLIGSIDSDGGEGRGDSIPTVASPLHKQRFDLRTGECLADETQKLDTYEVRIELDRVQVRPKFTAL